MSNIMQAFNQWSSRPADQRFWTLEEAFRASKAYAEASREAAIPWERINFVAGSDTDLRIETNGGGTVIARPTHFAFSQLAQRAGAPPSYLRSLPAGIVAEALNHGMRRRVANGTGTERAHVLFQQDGPDSVSIRCAVTSRYQRVWNYSIFAKLGEMQSHYPSWKIPPGRPAVPGQETRIATESDCLKGGKNGLSIKPGDVIGASGIYASDHDCFVFLVNEDLPITEGATGEPVNIGVIIVNSEVGDKSLRARLFLYDSVCGNHIVWGGREIAAFRRRHTGEIRARFNSDLMRSLNAAPQTARLLTGKVEEAKRFQFPGETKEKVLVEVGKAASKVGATLSQQVIGGGFDRADADRLYGSPSSLWGIVAGITANSQDDKGYTENRHGVDIEAGKLFKILN